MSYRQGEIKKVLSFFDPIKLCCMKQGEEKNYLT